MTVKPHSGEKFDYLPHASKTQRSKFLSKMLENCLKEYSIKFLAKWSSTPSFLSWKTEHSPDICYRADYQSQVDEVVIYYENGSMYKGPLVNGLQNG